MIIYKEKQKSNCFPGYDRMSVWHMNRLCQTENNAQRDIIAGLQCVSP